ncbi:MAG: hypothetical protein H3Z49_01410, partial [archaeon]|nr:hypothetical protein [archaeon]
MSSSNSNNAAPTDSSKEKPGTPAPKEAKPERRAPSNHIYIGKKPVMSYATSALIQLTQSD